MNTQVRSLESLAVAWRCGGELTKDEITRLLVNGQYVLTEEEYATFALAHKRPAQRRRFAPTRCW